MDKIELVDKLRTKANITYEEAKEALEMNNWDILEAMVYLEKQGRVKKPSISIFYTNEEKEGSRNYKETINEDQYREHGNENSKNSFNGFFEGVIKVIDTGNNIFIEIIKNGNVLLKIPLTVIILLFFFGFGIIIPLTLVALFFDIEFLIASDRIDIGRLQEVNKIFGKMSKAARDIKDKFKEG